MTATVVGSVGGMGWQPAARDRDGHRDYTLSTLVQTAYLDGPASVMNCGGLPAIGTIWNYGNDIDAWAFCWPDRRVTPLGRREQDKTYFWRVDDHFSTRPLKRCQDTSIENPLMEPQKISGTFTRYLKAVTKDRHGELIENYSHEPITGPDVEFNDSRPTVHIEQNAISLDLTTLDEFRDTVNDRELWGMDARCVLLTGIAWERLLYGVCTFYYKRIFDFEIDGDTFDRVTPQYGTMVRRGEWNPTTKKWVPDTTADKDDPRDFIRFKDFYGEVRRVLLDSEGDPVVNALGTGTGTGTGTDNGVRYKTIEHYPEKNFLLLDIPVILDP